MTDPRYVGSFPSADAPLDPPLPEIAFVGRSNVGKSSLLNALVGRRLARISTTPGKTRALNVFWIPGEERASAHPYYLLDLPGYGYARASKTDRTAYGRLVRHAIERPGLAGVVWLLDIRREPSDDDRAMQDLFAAARTPVLAAVTKSDKLPRGQRPGRGKALGATLELDDDQLILTSARTGDGIPELRVAIAGLAAGT